MTITITFARPTVRGPKLLLTAAVAVTLALSMLTMAGPNANAADPSPASVGLGTAGSYAVLAGSTITNTGATVITGDVGLHPGSSITGFPPGIVNGTTHAADAAALQAKNDLVTAYNDAAGRTPATTVPTELGGTTKTAGVYKSLSGTFGITGTLTLNGQGNPNSVWIFQMASTLITATNNSHVILINGASSCNVFWQVGSSATLGTNTAFVGTILASTSITANTGAKVQGRLLANTGAVTLDTNTVNNACISGGNGNGGGGDNDNNNGGKCGNDNGNNNDNHNDKNKGDNGHNGD